MESTPGGRGEEGVLRVELRLIADAGLIGLPNAGKSSLLNALTNANSKVGSYAFTTLDPHLGTLYEFVLADIPGLIEGAQNGKGLGSKFLRHIARTKFLLHCVSVDSEDPIKDYRIVRNEIESYQGGILKSKKEILILTKADTKSAEQLLSIKEKFRKIGEIPIYEVSILDDILIKNTRDSIVEKLRM